MKISKPLTKRPTYVIINDLNGYQGDAAMMTTTDESIGSAIRLSALISLLAIPGVVSAKDLEAELASNPHPTVSAVSNALQKIQSTAMIGSWSVTNAINVIARTHYNECRGESDADGRRAVADVIWNRAKNATGVVNVCLKKYQFSCWNDIAASEKTSTGYKFKIPTATGKTEMARWRESVDFATKMVNGTYTPKYNYNAYLNKDTANKSAVDSWGKSCTDKKGAHSFGYLKDQDPSAKKTTTKPVASVPKMQNVFHKIAKNETLGSIAQKYSAAYKCKITVADLQKWNPRDAKNPTALKVGAKLLIKVPKSK